MKQLELLYSNEVRLEDERRMKLDYCLTAEYASGRLEPYYGIRVTKHLDNLEEMEEVRGISYCRDSVASIIKKLFQHEVTPVHLIEIVDELITQGA